MAQWIIPRLVVLQSNKSNYGKYLYKVEEAKLRNYIKCNGSNVVDPLSKFSVEKSKSNKDLVHIRCCYNNKYFARISEESDFIGAAGDAVDEDQSKWSCTLFKPLPIDDKTYRFQHVQNGNNLCHWTGDGNDDCLIVRWSSSDKNGWDQFTVIDWESLVILPKHIVFKGDNGKYLQYRGDGGDNHMEFGCDDIGAIKVSSETVTNFDGSVCFKLDYNNCFWEATPNWIYPISPSPKTSFWPVKLAPVEETDNIIALKSLNNNKFCRRTDYGGTVNCLAAAEWATTIDKQANLQVEEPLLNREVYDVNFRLDDIRVYDEQILVLATDETSNLTDTEIQDSELNLEYEDKKTSNYSNSQSVKTSMEMGFEASIPIIEDLLSIGISSSFSVEYGNTYSWGEEKTKTSQLSADIKVVVPPKTKVTVDLVATKGLCDVPFSYAQRDTLTNGQQFTYIKNDGVYIGSNYFGFNFVVKEEPIPD